MPRTLKTTGRSKAITRHNAKGSSAARAGKPRAGFRPTRGISLAEFLKLPETKPASEYINGRIIQKVSPKQQHSRLQPKLWEKINAHTEPRRLGMAFTELRCTFGGRSVVFDTCYFRWDRIAYGPHGELLDDVFLAPDLAVEILSPRQPSKRLVSILEFAVANGVRLGWLIDPGKHSVTVFAPGREPQELTGDAWLDAGDVIPGFRCRLTEIFAWLRRPGSSTR